MDKFKIKWMIAIMLFFLFSRNCGLSQNVEWKAPPVIAEDEKMADFPSSSEYIAFSLTQAQELLKDYDFSKNYRTHFKKVYNLGGINQVLGLVYDEVSNEIVLVGKHISTRQPLTLDDFVVALKSRFIHREWPFVSIDPNEEKPRTGVQTVRFAKGIAQTQFGADLLDADYRLKRLGLGLLSAGINNFKSHWDLVLDNINRNSSWEKSIASRFWFYPILPDVLVRENVIAIRGLRVGVFTEILSAEINGELIADVSNYHDSASDQFAKKISERYEELSLIHPSFSRVQGLDELVALTKAMEEMDHLPDFSFWLNQYSVKYVHTPSTLKVLAREKEIESLANKGRFEMTYSLSGGVELMAIALRIKSGDVTALKEAVFISKNANDALSWTFLIGDWLIPTAPNVLKLEDIIPIIQQSSFLERNGHHSDAIALLGKVITVAPDMYWLYQLRGSSYHGNKQYEAAISDYTKAIELDSSKAELFELRAFANFVQDNYQEAIEDFNTVIDLDPNKQGVYYFRGLAYGFNGDLPQALEEFTAGIKIAPNSPMTYYNRGKVYAILNQPELAMADFGTALRLDPFCGSCYQDRGIIYETMLNDMSKACADYKKACDFGECERYLASIINGDCK